MKRMARRILHLEDNPDDAKLVRAFLASQNIAAKVLVVSHPDDYRAALARGGFDLIISDTSIPGFDAIAAIEAAQQVCRDVPLIVLSGGQNSAATAIKYKAAGAVDYVTKQDLSRLASVVQQAMHTPAPRTGTAFSYTHAMEKLVSAIQMLSLARDLDTVMKIVRRAARELTGADGATFVLREGESCYYADEDAIAPLWKGLRFPMSACISGWAMHHRQSAVIEDIYADARIPADAYRPTFVKSLVMVPIRTEAPIGAIGNYWASTHLASADEVKVLQALADSTSVALENIQLYAELEQRVRERTTQFEAANKELESFSYSVSHDLRAPLRSIDGFSQLLLRDAHGLDEQAQDKLHRICNAAQRMNGLIDDLLVLSRVTRAPLKKQKIHFARIAGEIIALLAAEAPERQVEWIVDDTIYAVGDPGLLRIVLENLLANAWKFTSKRPVARIEFGLLAQDEPVYYVRDNGAGFDSAHAEKLFGAFQRLHADTEFPGTGIGLATVARIIRRHGGRIWAEAAPDQGATFYFVLPQS